MDHLFCFHCCSVSQPCGSEVKERREATENENKRKHCQNHYHWIDHIMIFTPDAMMRLKSMKWSMVAMGLDSGTNGNVRMSILLLLLPLVWGRNRESWIRLQRWSRLRHRQYTVNEYRQFNDIKQLNFSAKLVVLSSDVAQTGIEMPEYVTGSRIQAKYFLGISIGLAGVL